MNLRWLPSSPPATAAVEEDEYPLNWRRPFTCWLNRSRNRESCQLSPIDLRPRPCPAPSSSWIWAWYRRLPPPRKKGARSSRPPSTAPAVWSAPLRKKGSNNITWRRWSSGPGLPYKTMKCILCRMQTMKWTPLSLISSVYLVGNALTRSRNGCRRSSLNVHDRNFSDPQSKNTK